MALAALLCACPQDPAAPARPSAAEPIAAPTAAPDPTPRVIGDRDADRGCPPERFAAPIDQSGRAGAKPIDIERPISVPVKGCDGTDWFTIPIARSGQLTVRIEERMSCRGRVRVSLMRDGTLLTQLAAPDPDADAFRLTGTQTGSATWHLSIEAADSGECDLFVDFDEQPPVIDTVTPASVAIGTKVTIRGSGFGADREAVEVVIGDAFASVLSVTDTRIVATVPFAARHGEVQLRVGEQATNPKRVHLGARSEPTLVPVYATPPADSDDSEIRDGVLIRVGPSIREAVVDALVGRWSGRKVAWHPLTNGWALRFPQQSLGAVETALAADERVRDVLPFPDDLSLARWVLAGAPAITSSAGETLIRLGEDASWPAVALVDAAGKLTGVVHTAGGSGQRLMLIDSQARLRAVLGRPLATKGAHSGWTSFQGGVLVLDELMNPRVADDLHGVHVLERAGRSQAEAPLASSKGDGWTVTVLGADGTPRITIDGNYDGTTALLGDDGVPYASTKRDHLRTAIELRSDGKVVLLFGDAGLDDPDTAWQGVVRAHPGEDAMLTRGRHLRYRDRWGRSQRVPAIRYRPALFNISSTDRTVGSRLDTPTGPVLRIAGP